MSSKPLSAYLSPLSPSCSTVAPMAEGETLDFGKSMQAETGLFDSIAQEQTDLTGTTVWWYSFNMVASKRDPLYDEPTARAYNLFKLKGFVTAPDNSKMAGMEGWQASWDAELTLPRASVEAVGATSPPGEMDVIRFWDTPYYNMQEAVDGFDVPGGGFYFSVVKCDQAGLLFDTASFTAFTLQLRRVSQQTAERRIRNEI